MSLLTKAGITKLSELIIDAGKDWQAKAITNLQAIAAGMTQGGVPFRGASIMEALAPTSSPNRFLKSQGPDADVAWGEPAVLMAPQRRRFDLLPEDAILPANGVGSPAGRIQIDGANLSYFVLDFDPAAEECTFWEWTLPEDFDPDRDIVVDIWWISTLNAGDVRFSVTIQGKTVNEAWDAALGSTYNVTRAPAGTAGDLMRSLLRITPTEWDALDTVILKLTRPVLAGHAADARVIAVAVQYGVVGQSTQTFFPLAAPVEVTATGMPDPGDYGVWKTLNLRTLAGIPEVATGIIFHFENYGALNDLKFGMRKTGSADDTAIEIGNKETHCWGMIGISTAGNVDVFIKYQNYGRLWIVGYTISGVHFFTNRIDKSPTGLDAWETVDCSAEAPAACALIFEVVTWDAFGAMGERKAGSTDDRIQGIGRHAWFIIGCDTAQKVDLYKDTANCWHYLVGYITDGAHFHTNGVDKSLGAIGTWTDILTVAGAKFAFIEVVGAGDYGLIKKGASEIDAVYLENEGHYWAIVEPDSDGYLRGKIAGLVTDFFLVGWATPQE